MKSAYPTDYHVHTPLCKHANSSMPAMVERARRLGLAEIGFADHICLPPGVQPQIRMEERELEVYVRQAQRLREEYAGLVTVRLGIEADFYPGLEDYVARLLDRHPFDFVIGSVHYLPGETPEPQLAARYLEAVNEAAASGLFDIVGHPSWVLRWDVPRPPDYPALVERVLDTAADKGLTVEINTSGLHHPRVGHTYPEAEFYPAIAARGLPVTLCSDAHSEVEIGFHFREVCRELRAAGVEQAALFANRQRTLIPFPGP